MRNALSDNRVLKTGEGYKNEHQGTTRSVVVFLTDYFRDTPAKEIAKLAGIGIRSAEGIKQGRQTFSMASLERAHRADPDFAAAWAAHVGLLLPGEAEYAGAATRAHNAWLRMKAARGEAAE